MNAFRTSSTVAHHMQVLLYFLPFCSCATCTVLSCRSCRNSLLEGSIGTSKAVYYITWQPLPLSNLDLKQCSHWLWPSFLFLLSKCKQQEVTVLLNYACIYNILQESATTPRYNTYVWHLVVLTRCNAPTVISCCTTPTQCFKLSRPTGH